MRYFGFAPQAEATREVILGYDPTIPSWAYNGNARRYWDFLYGGKYARIERQIHHYGSALNAVPLFDAFRRDPADLHLLRVRSEERRVGKECVSTCRSRWSPSHPKKNQTLQILGQYIK